jgi:hypothetical protein
MTPITPAAGKAYEPDPWRWSAPPKDGKHFHVSMLRVPFGPWHLIGAYSQRDV